MVSNSKFIGGWIACCSFKVKSIPSLLVFSKGEVQKQIVGAVGKNELSDALDELI